MEVSPSAEIADTDCSRVKASQASVSKGAGRFCPAGGWLPQSFPGPATSVNPLAVVAEDVLAAVRVGVHRPAGAVGEGAVAEGCKVGHVVNRQPKRGSGRSFGALPWPETQHARPSHGSCRALCWFPVRFAVVKG